MAKVASLDVSDAAKTLASRIGNHVVLVLAAEHLIGAAHVTTNQINENAKRMAMLFPLPEFNHHFLEALSFPRKAKHDFVAVLFQSESYHSRDHKRVELTAKLLGDHDIQPVIATVKGASKLEEVWRLIRLGASTSLELANASSINPEPVPNVEAFKKSLASR
jgi:hypothetical protein